MDNLKHLIIATFILLGACATPSLTERASRCAGVVRDVIVAACEDTCRYNNDGLRGKPARMLFFLDGEESQCICQPVEDSPQSKTRNPIQSLGL